MNLNRATLLSDALKRDETGPCQAQPAKTIRRKKSLKSLSRCVLTPCKKMTKGQRNRQTAPYRQPRNRDRNMAVWQLHPTDRWRRASAGRTAWDRKIQSTASLARSPWDNGVGGYMRMSLWQTRTLVWNLPESRATKHCPADAKSFPSPQGNTATCVFSTGIFPLNARHMRWGNSSMRPWGS